MSAHPSSLTESNSLGPIGKDLFNVIPSQNDSKNSLPVGTTAVVYCEGNFAEVDGKTANGLVRHSEKYKICSVIDSQKAGNDSGVVLDEIENGIPILPNLAAAISNCGPPDYFIFGIAPTSGKLSKKERSVVLEAISHGINIVSGLHEFLGDDIEFSSAAALNKVSIRDVRRPRATKDLRLFSGRIGEVTCPRIAVLGMDCAIGKRTTATILARALNDRGVKTILVGTGQTGLMQGARYGVALDAIPSQFCSGELEATIVDAFESEDPDVILIEGQGALGHPAFSTSAAILRGCEPDGVILQHAPRRTHRCDFDTMKIPSPKSEINLIQTFSSTKVIGVTLNHENMTDGEVETAIACYEAKLCLPVADALSQSNDHLVDMVVKAFPQLGEKLTSTQL